MGSELAIPRTTLNDRNLLARMKFFGNLTFPPLFEPNVSPCVRATFRLFDNVGETASSISSFLENIDEEQPEATLERGPFCSFLIRFDERLSTGACQIYGCVCSRDAPFAQHCPIDRKPSIN